MGQKYEIFNKEKVFVIADSNLSPNEKYVSLPLAEDEIPDYQKFFDTLQQYPAHPGIWISTSNPGAVFNAFASHFKMISASGAVVSNHTGEVLMMRRSGVWDLPKGKVEDGEFLRQAAKREISEECGIKQVDILKPLRPTWHIYGDNGQPTLKTTHWYEAICHDPENIAPQESEGITELMWVKLSEIGQFIEHTYPNIKIILALYASSHRR